MSEQQLVLAGDVGGTKTLLALVSGEDVIFERRYSSSAYEDLAHMIKEFLAVAGMLPLRGALGVAGPVANNRCRATNLPWQLDTEELQFSTGIKKLRLLNDFAAIAYGIGALESSEVVALNDAEPKLGGNVAILGAGTGLGEAFLVQCPQEASVVVTSEGSHADLAVRNEREIKVLQFLLRSHERVSVERVISGPGIATLFDFLVASGLEPSAQVQREVDSGEDVAAIVSSHALAGDCALCSEAIDLFLGFYGAEAGNLALKVLPTGGVYLAGGIAPKIIDLMRKGTFMKAFCDKGRMSDLVRSFPVRVVMNPRVGLLGAAIVAKGI